MKFARFLRIFPSWKSALLAVLAAAMLILAFPDFEYWFLAWFALVPLMMAVEREKESIVRSFVTGWLFGTIFFFGTCWWLTFAPITYAAFPPWLAYLGMVVVSLVVGLFPALFAAILSAFLRRFGSKVTFAATFIWLFTEFLRYWFVGNNWNAIGYSQAFCPQIMNSAFVSVSGVYGVGFVVLFVNSAIAGALIQIRNRSSVPIFSRLTVANIPHRIARATLFVTFFLFIWQVRYPIESPSDKSVTATVIAIQPNVPMAGLDYRKWGQLRQSQIDVAEREIARLREQPIAISQQLSANSKPSTLVILPESPMNFMYNDDLEFQQFIGDFARRNNVSVLFNSAEPDATKGKFFNSAVMVGPDGREAAQYDKIFLLPFGEAVPPLLEGIVPGFVGNFSYGREYDILPVGDAKAGVMICFESHFGQLSREYVRNGADVLIEMTNDGYLGPTPVLRQHLANAVFRAVETNRPVLRVTNVGITAYLNERGQVLDAASPYQEDTRVWSVSKSDGKQTFYVRYGDWFAWLSSLVSIGLLIFGVATGRKRKLATD